MKYVNICPNIIAKSSRKRPYMNKRNDANKLSCQKITGDNTLPALSDCSHCTINLAENNICARKPIEYIIYGGNLFYISLFNIVAYITGFHPTKSKTVVQWSP